MKDASPIPLSEPKLVSFGGAIKDIFVSAKELLCIVPIAVLTELTLPDFNSYYKAIISDSFKL